MIIITSNGDLIDRLSLNKSESTRIIDLDTNNLANTIFKNSTNAQMYKRVLNSPQYSRSKVPKLSQGEIDLVCVICEDHAIGFNYDVLTCASC
ncbi:unnamed protein product [Rotaria magnacalcarata]